MCPYVPSYANPNPTYQPAMRVISNITNAAIATVTTTFAHQYIVGTIIRLDIPLSGGMVQANQAVGTILTIPTPTTFTTDINTTTYDTFTTATPVGIVGYQDSQVVPIGEINDILTAATVNVLPL
jgi:hypothetical protein